MQTKPSCRQAITQQWRPHRPQLCATGPRKEPLQLGGGGVMVWKRG